VSGDGALARFLVVEASAGTGKTYFLEHRVVDLVLAGARIDQILVVTFTEKATAELKTRVRTLLAEMAADAARPAEARQRLLDAVAGFDRAPISTIHGFCQRLLVEDAFAGRRLFDQTQVADEVAFDDAFRTALRADLAVAPAQRVLLAAWLGAGKSVEQLRDVLLACARKAAPITPPFRPAVLAAAAAAARAAIAAVGGGAGVAAHLRGLHASTARAVPGRLDQVAEALDGLGGDDTEQAVALLERFSIKPASEALDYLSELGEKKSTPTADGRHLLDAVAALCAACVPIEAACAQAFLPVVLARVHTSKERRGQFDFQDMLRLVAETLRGPRGAELAARVRKRHPWALIDEFQDTDELQWEIFRTVWMAADAADARTGLAVVGDPKQAIYGFRGADVYTYLDARRELVAAGAEQVTLADNRRSTPALIDALNHLFAGASGPEFFTGDIGYDHPVRAAGDVAARDGAGAVPPPVTVLEVVAENGDKVPAAALKEAVIGAVVDEIAALLGDERRALWVTKNGAERRVRARDLFVLTRSNEDSDDVAAALRARGLPCAVYQREHLFAGAEADEVADLLEAIAAPRDRSARLRAWTTAFFDIPLADLGGLADLPDDHRLVASLFEWRALAVRMDYERLFARILDDTRLVERALVTGRGERLLGNVQHLFELLLAEVARSRCEIHELVTRLRRWISDGTLDRPDDSDVQRIETDGDAVQVMTIHRSKGLEAAAVFVVGGTGAGGRDRVHLYHDDERRRRAHVGSPTGDARERVDREREEENQRLCYVALTRAQARLYLPWCPTADVKPPAPYTAVHRGLGAIAPFRADPRIARWFAFQAVTAAAAPPAPALRVVGAELAGFVAPPPPPPVVPARLDGDRRGFAVTSYTRIKQGHAAIELDRGDEHRAEAVAGAPAPGPGELPGGAATGVFLHELLEHVDFASAAGELDPLRWAAQPAVAEVFDRAARRHDIDAAHLPHAQRLIHRALVQEVDLGGPGRRLCDAPARRIAREAEFVFPLPRGRGFVKGFIDLLVGWDDRVWVIDYKSDLLGGFGVDAARGHAADHYDVQQRLYALAAARMLGIAGPGDMHRLGGIAFWFLRPALVVDVRPTWDDLVAWQAWLAALEVS